MSAPNLRHEVLGRESDTTENSYACFDSDASDG